MTTLMPRFFGELFDWFDPDTLTRPGQLIRVEDRLTETEYLVRAELPGCDPQKDIQVGVDHGLLTIRCTREEQKQAHDRTEFRYGVLQRAIRLPGAVKEEKISAKYADGILEVKVPLTEPKPTSRQIPVAIPAK
ncbi:MAG: Hsp20/alpha crystallin family protein [Hamadaea sp.]|uniref:Hsp20/alpha crystallin family protein n=1 Tax=Hamadaea sp. TaxID=2024425 RepID=UPI00184F8A6C|nr:Hsp20/alpha crystallin family protein [Hamadaea sp.]NUR50784.1 Hsp20/alpha crystallin family protein [Hamadaea sp.]NUT18945.1 Hsp20/alpha crystallin family protein [Hamadaea sp.]